MLKLEVLSSNDGVTYNEASGASDIVTAHSPGSAFYSFSPAFSKFMKIKATETSGNAITSLTVKLAIQ